ncbi:MAG: hydantoinase B/oxoprolinase family protein [Hyphomonadaceae bacterium]|nr:hydantoinase B/oxoprolinase family protein [Hyphomonadaceae bacterium]MBC6413253.1 hydantoinase B/oxoprolinase family protein [Hyphomonadaceae bacterium]
MNRAPPPEIRDPVTIEVIQQSLGAITDEMFAVTRKTAMSSVIYEVLDFGVAVTDKDGALASAGAGIPSFIGMLDPGVRAIIKIFQSPEIREGDIFISNDPYTGGVSHTNDVAVSMPVFYGGEIAAWTANKGHWMDIGGMRPGSTSPDATELFQEGLLLPEVKIVDAGNLNDALLKTMMANSRLPGQLRGDFWAAIASLRMGTKRIQHICQKYGRDTFLFAVQDYLNTAERRVRRSLAQLPKGEFEATDRLDDGRGLHVKITVTDTEFVVDLSKNPEQDKGPLNSTYDATMVSVQAMFKSLTDPDGPANAGAFRPLKLVTEPGTLFHSVKPAATGLYYENKLRVSDLILKAVAPYFEQGRAAGHFCSVCATLVGQNNDDGSISSFIEPEVGGWGARADSDGENAQFSTSHGDTYTCPVEINEVRNGIRVDRLALNDEPGGAGQFRGGKGIELRYRILENRGWVTAAYTRSRVKPWGLNGGSSGTVNRLSVIRSNGSVETYQSASSVSLAKDDVIQIRTGNGAGYGDPAKRDPESILRDIRDGYISKREAHEVYHLDTALIRGGQT